MAETFRIDTSGFGGTPVLLRADSQEEADSLWINATREERVGAVRASLKNSAPRSFGITEGEIDAIIEQGSIDNPLFEDAVPDVGLVAQMRRKGRQQIAGLQQLVAEMDNQPGGDEREVAIAQLDRDTNEIFDALDATKSNLADAGEFLVPLLEIATGAGVGFLVGGPPGAVAGATIAGFGIGATKFQEVENAADRGVGTRLVDGAWEAVMARIGVGRSPGTVGLKEFADNKTISAGKNIGGLYLRVQNLFGVNKNVAREGNEAALRLLTSPDPAQQKLGVIALRKFNETYNAIPAAFGRRSAGIALERQNAVAADQFVATARAIIQTPATAGAEGGLVQTGAGLALNMKNWVAQTSGQNLARLKEVLVPKTYDMVVKFDDLVRTFASMGERVTGEMMESLIDASLKPGLAPLFNAMAKATTPVAKQRFATRILMRTRQGVRGTVEVGGQAVRQTAARGVAEGVSSTISDPTQAFVSDLFADE